MKGLRYAAYTLFTPELWQTQLLGAAMGTGAQVIGVSRPEQIQCCGGNWAHSLTMPRTTCMVAEMHHLDQISFEGKFI